jgi:hypothetical protein
MVECFGRVIGCILSIAFRLPAVRREGGGALTG